MAFDTAGNIINDAAVEIGLGTVVDPYTTQDANFAQLARLLKSCGRELVQARNWTYLRKEYTFTTVQGQSSYGLPSDFARMYDQSGWNRTNRLPMGGPLSAQEWQYLKARLVGVVFTVLFRPMNGTINLYPDTNTPGGYEIAFEYQSNWWAGPATLTNPYTGIWAQNTAYGLGDTVGYGATGNAHWVATTAGTSSVGADPLGATAFPTAPPTGTTETDGSVVWTFMADTGVISTTKECPTVSTDLVFFNPLLIIRSLKLAFLKAKGLDTVAAEQDYAATLNAVMGMDGPGKVLNLNRTSMDPSTVIIGGQSVPITGFGS